jgi:O-antigen/teichoic acid export membrane protein
MATDAIAVPAAARAKESGAGGGLTRRASLTALASLLDYFVKAGVSLVITPILVSGLGRTLYGVWEMLGRLVGYMSAADGRPTEALRLVVSQQQTADAMVNRKSVGAALVVWICMLPLVAVVGGALAWLAPSLTHAPASSYTDVRVTCILLVISFAFTSLAAIPESVLRGMNLGYKRMGLQASLSIVAGALAAWTVKEGFGLTGIGASQIVKAVLIGLCFWVLVRKFVPWFNVARPARPDVKRLLGMSVWLSVGELIAKLLLASDVLILGAIVSPAAVTTFVLTGYAARTGLGIFVFTAGSAMPGVGGVLGQGQIDRAVQLRRELLALTWLFVTVVGATILVWNRSFLGLWVGANNYAGPWVDLLIVLLVGQTAFIRTDSYIIDAALRPKARVVVGIITVVATLGLGITLTHAFGIFGLCLGMLLGRGIQSVAYPIIVRGCLQYPTRTGAGRVAVIRYTLCTALLFAAATALGRTFDAHSWVIWVLGVLLTMPLFASLALALGAAPESRRAIIRRIRGMATGVRKSEPPAV